MLKKAGLFIPILLCFCLSSLYPQEHKVTVTTNEAPIYTEANENSIQMDLIKRGAVLMLFEPWENEKTWLYVTYTSAKWNAKVTGFIQSSFVARGEIAQDELVKKQVTRADADMTKKRKSQATEVEIELDKLPSLKDVFRPREEIKETKTEEETSQKEAVEFEKLQPEIKKKVEPIITEFLGETEILEARTIDPAAGEERVLNAYAILEKPSQAATEAIPPKAEVIEETKEPEIIPVQTKVISVESDTPKQRNIATAPTTETESRVFAIIKEEMPKPEVQRAVAEALTKAEKPEIEVAPFEVAFKEPETEQTETKEAKKLEKLETEEPLAQKDAIKPEKEALKKEKKAEEIKGETPPEAQPEEKAAAKPRLETQPEKTLEKQEAPPVQQRKPPPELIKPKLPVRRMGLLTMGLGYGPSFGGFGAFLQLNTKAGFSIHAGVGYYPATVYYSEFDWLQNKILFSAGMKYYLPFGNDRLKPYFNLQYGGLSVEAVQVETGLWYGQKIYENIQKSLYGPSLLGGMEWRMGFLGLNGSLGLSYNTTEWQYWERNLFLNGDIALVIYF